MRRIRCTMKTSPVAIAQLHIVQGKPIRLHPRCVIGRGSWSLRSEPTRPPAIPTGTTVVIGVGDRSMSEPVIAVAELQTDLPAIADLLDLVVITPPRIPRLLSQE